MRAFAYERPTNLAEAVALLAEHGPEARLLAGGTDLIIRLRDGSIRPRIVVDVKGIAELDGGDPRDGDGRLAIGARAVMTDIAADERIRRDFPALAEAAAVVGSVQIRNRATLAGNICNASPAADTVPALLVYGARVVVAPARRHPAHPDRRVLRRSGVTTLARGELVTAIELPLPRTAAGAVHVRRTRRRGHDLASVTLACAVVDRRRDARSPTAASGRGRSSSPMRPACSPTRRRPDRAKWSGSRRCSSGPARRRDRCGRAPSTAWRCCASSACGRSASRSSASPSGGGAPMTTTRRSS